MCCKDMAMGLGNPQICMASRKNLVASKGGSGTESETCLYDSLGHCTSLRVVPPIEGGWLTF